jgi:Cu/Ag efflux protein CusF
MKEIDLSKQFRITNAGIRSAMIALFLVTSIGFFFAGCGTAPTENKTQAQVKRFSLKGKVTKIDKPSRELLVDHEAIPGFMGAMEMPYPVADVKSLDTVAVGDEIRADLVVTDGHAALENIVVTKKGEHRLEIPKPSGVNYAWPQPLEGIIAAATGLES